MDEIKIEDLEGYARVEVIARIFGLSSRRVQQLTQDGILSTIQVQDGHGPGRARRYELLPTLKSYYEYLNAKSTGKASKDAEAELKVKKLEAEVALKASQGELHQLKTAIASGEYISVAEVQGDYERFFDTFKKFALALPARLVGMASGQLGPEEERRLEKELSEEVSSLLEAFVVAGTEAKPTKPKKPKVGRPKKAPES